MTLLSGQDLLRPAIQSLVQPEDFDFLFSDSRAAPKLGQDPYQPAILEVVQIWEGAAMAMAHLRPDGKDLSLGGLDATFTAPGGEGADRPLFQSKGGLFILRLAPGWTGFLQDGQGQRQPLSAPAPGEDPADVVLPAGMSAWIDSGHVIFAARHVPPGRRPKAAAGPIDTPFVGALSAVSMLAGLIALVVATSPPPAQAEVAEVPERILQMMLQVPEPTPAPEIKAQATNKEEGAKAKGAEGKAGRKESKMARARGERSAMDRQKLDQQIAEQAGILGHLSDNGALDDVFGSSALNADLQGGIGGLVGAKGVQLGSGGLSSRGSALGGGGPAEGIGGVGTKGRNTGDGRYGEEGGAFGDGKREGKIRRPDADFITLGSLDKSLIDAVVKQHMSALRYCYQRELTRQPDLAGKVTVKFIIAGDGSVSKASIKSSSLGNTAVESCMTGRFLRMKFPEPAGHGIVIVSYPFLFSAG